MVLFYNPKFRDTCRNYTNDFIKYRSQVLMYFSYLSLHCEDETRWLDETWNVMIRESKFVVTLRLYVRIFKTRIDLSLMQTFYELHQSLMCLKLLDVLIRWLKCYWRHCVDSVVLLCLLKIHYVTHFSVNASVAWLCWITWVISNDVIK